MKGLKIIPMFLVLIVLSFTGALFVDKNPDPVSINFFRYVTPPAKLGLVVLSSMMLGMLVAGVLCSVELLALFVQNKNLRRRLNHQRPHSPATPTPLSRATGFRSLDIVSEAKPEPKSVDEEDKAQTTGSFNKL